MKDYGYFSDKRYIITERDIPRHWYNYFFNDEYVAFVSQVGFGQGIAQDSMGRRINLVDDRAVYVVEGNKFWQANGLPVHEGVEDYSCAHGIGYTDISLKKWNIRSECRYFVPNEGKKEYIRVTLTNESDTERELKLIPYCATEIDCRYAPQGY